VTTDPKRARRVPRIRNATEPELFLERVTAEGPEVLELTVLRHYRSRPSPLMCSRTSIGTIHLTKSERLAVSSSHPVEAHTLAGELRRLVHASEAPPLSEAPSMAVTPPERPTPIRYQGREARFRARVGSPGARGTRNERSWTRESRAVSFCTR
jgi:hypothetical protein